MQCLFEVNGICKLWKPTGDPTIGGSTHGSSGDETTDYYSPPGSGGGDDTYDDPDPDPDPEPIDYPDIPAVRNDVFSLFFSGYSNGISRVEVASYPYQRTKNGKKLFSYSIDVTSAGTKFVVEDNKGSFSVAIGEVLTGHFCAKLKFGGGGMGVKVWGGSTDGAEAFATISTRNVTFYKDKIVGLSI